MPEQRLITSHCVRPWVSRNQKGKPFWILLKLDHMQIICTTLQTDNHASTPSLNFLWAGRRMLFLTPNQQCQSNEGSARHNLINALQMIFTTTTTTTALLTLSRITQVSWYQNQILLKQETVSGSGISLAICKSASRPRQITKQTIFKVPFINFCK